MEMEVIRYLKLERSALIDRLELLKYHQRLSELDKKEDDDDYYSAAFLECIKKDEYSNEYGWGDLPGLNDPKVETVLCKLHLVVRSLNDVKVLKEKATLLDNISNACDFIGKKFRGAKA